MASSRQFDTTSAFICLHERPVSSFDSHGYVLHGKFRYVKISIQLITGMLISYVGTGKSIVRQYNRSMVLIPSPPTSAAFINKTWPVQIINDMLTVVPVMTDELSASIVEKAKRSASARGRGGRYQRASANPKLVVVKNLSLLTKVAPLPVVIGVQQQQQPAVAAVQN